MSGTEHMLNGLKPKGTNSVATLVSLKIYMEANSSVYYLFSG